MIHSARLTVSPVAIIAIAWNFFLFWKVETDGRTDDMCKNNDHYRPWLWVGLVNPLKCDILHWTPCSTPRDSMTFKAHVWKIKLIKMNWRINARYLKYLRFSVCWDIQCSKKTKKIKLRFFGLVQICVRKISALSCYVTTQVNINKYFLRRMPIS